MLPIFIINKSIKGRMRGGTLHLLPWLLNTSLCCIYTLERWRGGAMGRALDLGSTGRGFKSYSEQKLHNNLGQVVQLTGHFGTRTFRHQDSSAPVQNGAEVSRDNSAPDFYWCRTVRILRHQCRNTSRRFGTIRQKYIIWAIVSSE